MSGRSRQRRLVIFGRQGAGKGTQCVRSGRALRRAPHLDRATCCAPRWPRAPTSAARPRSTWTPGGLVPDEVMLGIVDERLAERRRRRPRLPARRLPPHGRAGRGARSTSPPIDLGRRTSTCPRTSCSSASRAVGSAQNCGSDLLDRRAAEHDWICDICGGEVVQRADDTPEAIAQAPRRLQRRDRARDRLVRRARAAGRRSTAWARPTRCSARLIAAIDARAR